jgi:hypothetical protein
MMSDNLILLSSDTISYDDFAAFLTEIGGVLKPGGAKDGQFSRGRCHLWIFLSPGNLVEAIEDLGSAITEKLGSLPQGCVVLEVSRAPGTERLALEFSIAFAERWHAVLWDPLDRLWTLADLRRALHGGERLGVSA